MTRDFSDSHDAKPIAILLALTLLFAFFTPALGQSTPAVTFQRDVSPASIVLGQGEFTVTLSITGNGSACGPGVKTHKPLDIVLVIDRSGSMAGDKLDGAKAAAKAFLSKVNLGQDKVGLVEFNAIATMAQALDTNRQNLERGVDALSSWDGTAIDQGVEVARQELKSARRRADANPVIVLLTDGQSNEDAAMRAATAAKSEGVRLIAIGLGSDVNKNLLQNMASQPSDYYFAPDGNALTKIYGDIAESIKQFVAATDLTLKHTLDATAFQIVPGSISPAGSVTGSTITWTLNSLGDTKQTFSYRVKPLAAGKFNVDQGDIITYKECEQTSKTITEKAGLPIQAIAPTPTPTRTATSTRAPTRTPLPTPLPTPTPTFDQQVKQNVCDAAALPLWALCLLPLLVLFLIWFLWRLWQELQKPREDQYPCPLIWWLLLPLALILLYLILSQFLNAACIGGESVYFWRINPDGSSGIYVSSQDGARPAQPFSQVNQGGRCVACHAVSSTSHRIAAITTSGTGPVVVYGLDGKPISIPSVTGSFLSWSPDGTKLAVSTDQQQIIIVDIERGSVTPLAGASEPGVAQVMPAWSPDGSTIAFVRSTGSSGAYRLDAPADIYTVPAEGGTATPLPGASGDGFNYYPAYSPDGQWLAFTRHVSGTTTYSDPYAEIFLVPAGGGTPIRLAANDASDGKPPSKVSNSWPTWSRDGKLLAFNSKRNGNQYDIFVTNINPDGTSGAAVPLQSAADSNAFEHLPFWGEPPKVDPWAGILGLWPCLFPFLLIPLLYLLCRYLHRVEVVPPPPMDPGRPRPEPLEPLKLPTPWQVAPTLVIGVGGTGRWVLTHLKKSLRDGGLGEIPKGIRFILLDTSEEETNVVLDASGKPQAVEFAGVRLEPSEMLLFQDNLESIVRAMKTNAAAEPALRVWFPVENYAQVPSGQTNLALGTRGRRPLARAGLIKKLLAEADRRQALEDVPESSASARATMLWEMLTSGARLVLDNRQVRIILVGSLAGGMSGMLFDLAHLARMAGQTAVPRGGTVTVEGYFATAGAFKQVPGNAGQRQVDTYAAVRELQRFQLSQGQAYPMRYRADSNPPLESVCTKPIFEDVFLFGTGGLPETGPGKESQPWATVFASMADVIAFRMDRGVRAGSEIDYRRDIQTQTTTLQQQQNVAFVGGAGSFVFRLPMYDIVEQIKARWARQLLHEFIQGTEQSQPSREKVETDVSDFFRGQYGCGAPPEGMSVLESLSADVGVRSADLKRLVESADSKKFRTYLQHALSLILNGKKAARTVPRGRVRFAIQFLEVIATRLKRAEKAAEAAKDSVKADLQPAYEQAKDLAVRWRGEVESTLQHLRQQRDLLEGSAPVPGQPSKLGAYQIIANMETETKNRRAQMDRVAVREYLWWRAKDPSQPLTDPQNQVDLADEWYYLAADQHIQEYLERLYWEFTPDGALRLSITTFKDDQDKPTVVTLGADSPDAFVSELLRLGDRVVKEIWEKVTLTEIMRSRQMIADEDQAIQTATRMWMAGTPHLQSRQNTKTWNAAYGLPNTLRESARELVTVFANLGGVEQKIPSRLNPCKTASVQLTDQYATVLVRTLDLVAVTDIPEMDEARRLYEQSLRGTVSAVEGAELQAVFAAERRALAYEKRLPDANIYRLPLRQFHPLVVMALENEARARLFALGYAADWLRVPENAGNITLTLPGSAAEVLGEKTPEVKLAGEVTALLYFCQRAEERFVQAVRAAVENPDEPTLAAWREYYSRWHDWQGTPPMANEPRELQDFAAFAALVVYDTLKARVGR